MTGTAVEQVQARDMEARQHLNRVLVTADQMAAATGLLRADLRGKVQDVRAIALTLDQHGLPITIQNLNACYVVKGAVEFMTRLWTGLALRHGHRVWLCDADPDKCKCQTPSSAEEGRAHLQRGDDGMTYTATFSWADAQRAGLLERWDKDKGKKVPTETYTGFPTDMLGWRALSRVVKRYAPDIVVGVGEAIPDTVTHARPRPPAFDAPLPEQDEDIADAELVEQGEDPGLAPAQTSEGAGSSPGTPAPSADQEPERGPDNAAAQVVGQQTAPAPSGPVPGEWRARAAEQGVSDALLLKKAREFAGERGVEGTALPRTLDQVTDPADIARLEEWLG